MGIRRAASAVRLGQCSGPPSPQTPQANLAEERCRPRISIIIAHQHDQRLEDTLLSVLECRPKDCEIIVAHDGRTPIPINWPMKFSLLKPMLAARKLPKSTKPIRSLFASRALAQRRCQGN